MTQIKDLTHHINPTWSRLTRECYICNKPVFPENPLSMTSHEYVCYTYNQDMIPVEHRDQFDAEVKSTAELRERVRARRAARNK